MAGKSINDVFNEIIADYQAVATEAVKSAAKKVQDDVVKESYRYMAIYYRNHKPTKYKRTKQLHKSITPIFEDRSGKRGISIEVGVEYNSSNLKGLYYSNSWYHQTGTRWIERNDEGFDFDSQNNGIPQPEWILENFLEGIHPITKAIKKDRGFSYIYTPKRDSESTQTLMEEFFDVRLPERINDYVQEELVGTIMKRF